jgi:hypothetical protein
MHTRVSKRDSRVAELGGLNGRAVAGLWRKHFDVVGAVDVMGNDLERHLEVIFRQCINVDAPKIAVVFSEGELNCVLKLVENAHKRVVAVIVGNDFVRLPISFVSIVVLVDVGLIEEEKSVSPVFGRKGGVGSAPEEAVLGMQQRQIDFGLVRVQGNLSARKHELKVIARIANVLVVRCNRHVENAVLQDGVGGGEFVEILVGLNRNSLVMDQVGGNHGHVCVDVLVVGGKTDFMAFPVDKTVFDVIVAFDEDAGNIEKQSTHRINRDTAADIRVCCRSQTPDSRSHH